MSKRRKKFFATRECAAIIARHPTTGKEIIVNYQKDAMIGPNIDEELTRFPGLLAWWLQLRDIAKDDLDDARHREHNIEEDLGIKIRDMTEKRGERPTETLIKTRVRAHPKMRSAFRKRMLAERRWRQLNSAVEAMIEKKWAMRSMIEHKRIDFVSKDSY